MSYSIEAAAWPDDRDALRQVRETVFVREQGVPLDMEWDDHDTLALHLLARDALGRPIDQNDQETLRVWREEGIDRFLKK